MPSGPESKMNPPEQIELSGVLVYVGTTGVGKTYLAKEHLFKLHKAGARCLIIDSAGVENFDEIEHVETPREVAQAIWRSNAPRMVAWTPGDTEEETDQFQLDKMMQAIRVAKGPPIAVLVDEVSFWKDSPQLKMLCRTWRHSNATMLLTSQHVSADVGQVIFGCNPQLFIFRTTAPRSVEFVMKNHGLDPEKIKSLPDREYVWTRM